jgi:hypothetical protein
MDAGRLGAGLHPFDFERLVEGADIAGNGFGHQRIVPHHDSDLAAERAHPELAQRGPVDQDIARGWAKQTGHDFGEGCIETTGDRAQ